jgi:hypothetical protein
MPFKAQKVTQEMIDSQFRWASEGGTITGEFGEFGWGYDHLSSFEEKLSYVLTAIKEHVKGSGQYGEPTLDEYKTDPRFVRLAAFIKAKTGCSLDVVLSDDDFCKMGYIDHESVDLLDDVFNATDEEYDEMMTRLLFGDVCIIIDNDNH